MFEQFSDKLQAKINEISRKNNLKEEDIKKVIRELRLILLEADVNYKVTKEFCKSIEEKAINQEVLKGLNVSEQIIKIVKDEMIELLSGDHNLKLKENKIILMVGLQGSGKTTMTGKLAAYLRKKKQAKNPLLVACDVYRPAAVEQLKILAKQIAVDVYSEDHQDVNLIVKNALKYAQDNNNDLIILDTAGRMHVDQELMEEIKTLQDNYQPEQTMLVLDGAVGQIAVEIASQFNEYVDLTGLIFTKMDGDSRGGAVFSVKKVTDLDIKFLGTSEKMDGIEHFDANRVVERILGMGDVLGLIEKAEEAAQNEDMDEMADKMMEGKFDLTDFLKQMKMMKKMGGLSSILGMMPNMKKLDMSKFDEKEIIRMQAIIESMTQEERKQPAILNASRRQRIAKGSGTKVQDVNKLIKGYENSKKMMKQLKGMDPNKMMNMFK